MKMMNNSNVNCFADLEREEIRIKNRLKKQEELLKLKFQTLPEELVKTGITKLIGGLLSGNMFKSAVSIMKTVGKVISESKMENPESSGSFMDIIKNIIKKKLSL